MRILSCVIAALVLIPLNARELDSCLKELDQLVENKAVYTEKRAAVIDSLKMRLAYTTTLDEKIVLANHLDLQYIVYQTDSALVYANLMLKYAKEKGDRARIVESTVNVARILDVMGQYKEALAMLDSVSDNVPEREKTAFAYCRLTIYNSLTEYTIDRYSREKYDSIATVYRDSLLNHYSLSPTNKLYVQAEDMIHSERYEEARQLLENKYASLDPRERDAGIIAYSLGVVHRALGDEETATLYFVRSSIADMYSGVKEHKSLQIVSEIMYDRHDVDRAYRYAKSAMQDYIYCNARLRTLEMSNIFVLIDHAYQEKKHQATTTMMVFLVTLAAFIVVSVCFLLYLRHINRRLKVAKQRYYDANVKIKSVSDKLRDANMIKEEYISLYMEQSSEYLDKVNHIKNRMNKNIRRSVDPKMLLEELEKSIDMEAEVKNFYHVFDVTVLHMFPDFPAKMDELLVPEARGIYSKTDDSLSPEYRIFALIRLGITDSAKIARFLRYSLSTIYNYRTKLRNKAIGSREDFEKNVMKIDSL